MYNIDEQSLIKTYEYLHTIPEPEFQEFKTSDYIKNFLKNVGLTPITCATTGVYADIIGDSQSSNSLLIRADIDALPMEENSGVAFQSLNKGFMHACGHDMHTTCLLYAAKYLAENTDKFCGKIRVVFQPAEEGTGGASKMIEEGVLNGITASVAMHVEPMEDVGTLIYKDGGITASPDDFKIVIKGKGGHAAEPEKCINPITASAELVLEYNQIKNKFFNDEDCILTVCTCNGGTFNNIIPDTVEITGTARSFCSKTRYKLRDKLSEIAKLVCKKNNVEYDFIYNELYPPTVNSSKINQIVLEAAKKTKTISKILELEKGSMTGDDFAYFAEKTPASYYRFGVGGVGERYPLHSSKFKIDENSLTPACELIINIALEYLK